MAAQGEGGVAQDPGRDAGLLCGLEKGAAGLQQSGWGHRDGEFQAGSSLAS